MTVTLSKQNALMGRRGLAWQERSGFTLLELMVSMAVLALLIAMVAQMFSNATMVTSMSSAHLEADDRARLLFARMAADFARIVKRSDVDYYVKTPTVPQNGNDQLAFYSEVPGYSTVTSSFSSISLVAYRFNSNGKDGRPCVERLSKALSWGTVGDGLAPVAFLPVTLCRLVTR